MTEKSPEKDKKSKALPKALDTDEEDEEYVPKSAAAQAEKQRKALARGKKRAERLRG